MKELTILVDLDGIIADSIPHWLDAIHKKFGVKAELKDITQWNLTDCPPLDKLQRQKILDLINQKGFVASIPPMPGALENLKKLHDDGHQIYIVTARTGDVSIPETFAWVRKHLPWFDVEKRLCFLYDKFRFKADIVIDDKWDTLEKYERANKLALLYTIDYPYNKGNDAKYEVTRIQRSETAWDELYESIKDWALT